MKVFVGKMQASYFRSTAQKKKLLKRHSREVSTVRGVPDFGANRVCFIPRLAALISLQSSGLQCSSVELLKCVTAFI